MAFTVKKQAKLNFKKNKTFKILRTGSFLPSSLGGLSLWLKADAGVSKFSFNYISKIVISGASNANVNGTYTATSVPYYDFDNGIPDDYSFSGPSNGFGMNWLGEDGFILAKNFGDGDAIFSSSDGQTWTIASQALTQVVISGFTGDYAGANGSYTYDTDYEALFNGYCAIYGTNIENVDTDEVLATNTNANYSGSWTLVNGTGNPVTTSVTIIPNGSISGITTTSTANTDLVTAWADQSGNSIVLTPDNQNSPTFVSSFLNGKPAIEFIVGSNTGLSNTSFGLTGFTFFSVTKQKPTNTGRIFSSYFGNVLIGTWGIYSNRFYGGEDNGWLAEGEQTSTDFLITTAFSDPNTTFDFSQNGVSQFSGASNSTVILNGISVGGGVWNGGNEEASDSYVCEIVIYNRTLTLTERQQVEAYLNQKYQIY